MINIRRYMQYWMGGVVLILGLTFSFSGYELLSQMAENDASRTFGLITKQSGYAVDHLLQPATTLIKLLANVPDLKTGNEKDWMLRVPAQASILLDNNMLSSVYVGGPQGQFFLLQILRSDWDRDRFNAPINTRWIVQLQRVNKDEGDTQFWVGLDDKFKVIFRKPAPFKSNYDPLTRPWYKGALVRDDVVRTEVYPFFSTGKKGVTISKKMGDGWVVAMDIRVESLETELSRLSKDFTAKIALLEQSGVVMSADKNKTPSDSFFKSLVEVSQSYVGGIFKWMKDPYGKLWLVGFDSVKLGQLEDMQLHVAVPENFLLERAKSLRDIFLITTLMLTAVTLFFSRYSASKVSVALQNLAARANAIVNFDFSSSSSSRVNIKEVAQLEAGLERARTTLSNFIVLLEKVSREDDLEKLLPLVLEETSGIVQGENAAIYIHDGADWALRAEIGETKHIDCLAEWLSLADIDKASHQAIEISIGEQYALMVPLFGRKGQILGLMIIELSHGLSQQHKNFIKALSGFAALTLESREMVIQQKQLFESFIRMLADAVDAKSPHTGGHCFRVPVLRKVRTSP